MYVVKNETAIREISAIEGHTRKRFNLPVLPTSMNANIRIQIEFHPICREPFPVG